MCKCETNTWTTHSDQSLVSKSSPASFLRCPLSVLHVTPVLGPLFLQQSGQVPLLAPSLAPARAGSAGPRAPQSDWCTRRFSVPFTVHVQTVLHEHSFDTGAAVFLLHVT